MQEKLSFHPEWFIYKHKAIYKTFLGIPVSHSLLCKLPWFQPELEPEPYEVSHIVGNLALTEGITVVAGLIIGNGATAFNNANSYLGVGADTTAADAAQTGLQAPSNKLYKAMDATFPSISGSTITWQATFGTSEANFDWREFTIANGSSDAAANLNRKVTSQGTKDSSMSWILQLKIVIS